MAERPLVYLTGSLRNPRVPELGQKLRRLGYEVFDDWYAAGPTADDCWKAYEEARHHQYQAALEGWAARHTYEFDRRHMERASVGVLALPAGRSAHLELGVMIGWGLPTFILLSPTGDPDRWDVMYQFATAVCKNFSELRVELKRHVA